MRRYSAARGGARLSGQRGDLNGAYEFGMVVRVDARGSRGVEPAENTVQDCSTGAGDRLRQACTQRFVARGYRA